MAMREAVDLKERRAAQAFLVASGLSANRLRHFLNILASTTT
jgi:hypothetical protein